MQYFEVLSGMCGFIRAYVPLMNLQVLPSKDPACRKRRQTGEDFVLYMKRQKVPEICGIVQFFQGVFGQFQKNLMTVKFL